MYRFLRKRLLGALITLIGVTLLIFLLGRVLPGDPARVIAGPMATEADLQSIREDLGLDKGLVEQYRLYAFSLVRGDLGVSARTRNPVMQEIGPRLTNTVKLTTVATGISALVGITAGVVAARYRGRVVDHVISGLSAMGIALPVYWSGSLLILLFAVQLRWLPAAGAEGAFSIVLPSITLAGFGITLVARMTRGRMLDVLQLDYILMARAKGVGKFGVDIRHGLRNALVPIVTIIGLQFGALLGGAVLTENVFGWPGMGRLLVDSIFGRDLPMIQGIILIFATMFILVNVAVDVLYGYLDPKIRY